MKQADAGAESDRDADVDEATHSPKQWKVLPTIAFTFLPSVAFQAHTQGGFGPEPAYKK